MPLRRPPPRWGFAALAVALLTLGGSPGIAGAGVSDYPATLYLSGTTSTLLAGSFTLVAGQGPGQGTNTLTGVASGVGSLTGPYTYAYTLVDPATGGETAVSNPTSASVTATGKSIVTVGNLPTGVHVRLYRQKSTGLFTEVADLPSNASSTYADSMSDATAALQSKLPQTQNRVALLTTGWEDFQPGVFTLTPTGSTAFPQTPATGTPSGVTGKGWIVDGSGGVSFAAGTWTFQANVKTAAVGTNSSHIAVGMWSVQVSGGAITGSTMLIDPAGAGEQAGNTVNTSTAQHLVSLSVPLSTFSLASGDHLYIQLYRHQTTTSAGQQLVSLLAYDGTAQIKRPSFPDVPALVSPVDTTRVNTTPPLSATFSDPDAGDTGTLQFQLCSSSDPSCSTPLQSDTTASGIANGSNGTWTPTSLSDGMYYWRAQSTDNSGNVSGWSATSSFTVDTVPPGVPTLSTPAAAARIAGGALNAVFVDGDSTDTGSVDYQVCSDAACSSVVASGSSSPAVAGGTSTSWSPGGLTGTPPTGYYWRVSGVDVAGNQSAWSATRSFTYDTNPPGTPSLVSPADGTYLGAGAGLDATFSSGDSGDSGSVAFQICSDAPCSSVVASGSSSSGLANGASGSWVPGGLADGSYYWRARAQDAAGNQSGWSAVRQLLRDVTPPAVPTLGSIPALVTSTPQVSASYSDPPASDSGSLTFQLCTDVTCATVLQSSTSSAVAAGGSASWTPSGLGDDGYYLRVRAEDSAGNLSAWSTVRSFWIDTTAPPAPALTAGTGVHVHASPQLGAIVIEPSNPGDSARILVELCTDPACTSVVTTGYTGFVSVDTAAGWQAPPLADGVYYWRALAEDLAGNQSPWSAVGSFVVDTVPPAVPALGGPAVGAVVNSPRLTPALDTPAGGGVGFQVCADAACTRVVAGGYAASPASGAVPSWTPKRLPDGTYFWRIDAHDEAGNESAWSATKSFVLDQTPPGTPRALEAKVAGKTLMLRWQAPARAAHLVGYALVVDGRRTLALTAKTHTLRIKLRKDETRRFAVVAVDAAGNVSLPTRQVRPNSLR